MAVNNYLTTQGRILVSKMLASQRLVYTRAVATADTIPTDPTLLSAFTAQNQTATGLTVTQESDYAVIAATFSCSTLLASYQLSMIGFYAKIEGQTDDVLYMVSTFDPDDGVITLPAQQNITYRFLLHDSVASGSLSITVADSSAAPFEHVANPRRHIFTQTNTSTTAAVVDGGDYTGFVNGQKILFVPAATLTAGTSTLSITNQSYSLTAVDLAGNSVSYVFLPNKSYILTYLNGAFRYVKHNEIEVSSGVAHYWTGAAWKTVIPAGQINAFAGATAPAGTVLCDGSALTRTSYPELFAAIGTTYGSTSDSDFKVPDLRGKVVLGTSTAHTLGSTGGSETVSLTSAQLPAHGHTGTITINLGSHYHTGTTGSAGGHTHAGTSLSVESAGSHSHLNGVGDNANGSTATNEIFPYGWRTISSGFDSSYASTHRKGVSADEDTISGDIYTGKTNNGGSHSHSVSGNTGTAGSHTHSFTTGGTELGSKTASFSTDNTGTGTAHDNMMPYLTLNYVIYTGRSLL